MVHKFFQKISRLIPKVLSCFYYPLIFKKFDRKTVLETPLFLANPCFISIGRNTSVRKGVRLEVVREEGASPDLSIGQNCLIEQNVQIICRRKVSIGSNVSIAAHCAIVDVSHPYAEAGHENKEERR
jgi:acetyltransferase-like isoleucine patch superfamily enzyme